MTQEQHIEGNEIQDESMDSPVIKALRKQIADLTKERSNAPTREAIEAEIREGIARESAIAEQLIALGHPKGLSEFLKGKLGDAEVTRESVAAALQGIGYQVVVDDAAQAEAAESSVNLSDLANVSTLSAKVRAAAQPDHSDLASKIAKAETSAEITQLMADAGLLAGS